MGSRRGRQLALEGPWTRHGVPAGDYMPRAALVGTHAFFGENRHAPPKLSYLLGLLQLAKQLCPFKLYRASVQGGVSIPFTSRSEVAQC